MTFFVLRWGDIPVTRWCKTACHLANSYWKSNLAPQGLVLFRFVRHQLTRTSDPSNTRIVMGIIIDGLHIVL